MIVTTNVKVNIGLNVIRKREDGFHDLDTLFYPYFGIGDTLEVILGDDYSRTSAKLQAKYSTDGEFPQLKQGISDDGKLMITIARKEGLDWEPLKDLCAKAYFALAKDFQLPPVKIFLEKTAPVGAGLGGGSADAAFTLKLLNQLCNLNLTDASLASYASMLGSDCAFFIYNRPMLGQGRGDVLKDYTLPFVIDTGGDTSREDAQYEMKVVVPEGISISTAEAYKGIVAHEPEHPICEILSRPIQEWRALLFNDFELELCVTYPELERVRTSLYDSGAVYASMSGSGSAFFAIYSKE